jgi:ABC-type antimicrobial peptide transport system permease subunit
MAILLRGTGNPASLGAPARDALRRVHGGLPVYDIRTMREVRRFTSWEQQLFGTMMGAFAATALLLACLGVYALLAYAARRRTHEIGVRLALGAEPRDVVTLFVGQAGAAGLTVGLALALAVARALSGTLFAVDAFDPWLFVSMGSVLFAGGPGSRISSCPPRRACRSDDGVEDRVKERLELQVTSYKLQVTN